ncbi:Elongator complex protein 1 [Dillenia turbinata]|uniref:Elongator complex protein 1 n=1 Tax=Dillenia turbinata TaxID=194707 RepID=A0AAN8ZCX5_9MAGN
MKNLKLSAELTLNLELQSKDEVIIFSAFDIERNRLFFASSSNFLYTTNLHSFQQGSTWGKASLSADVEPLDLEPEDIITSFDYLMEKESLIIGTSSGFMLLHSGDGTGTEVVGKLEGGVKCISPSPDGDLIAVISGLGQILVMTHDWDLLYETALEDSSEVIDVSEPISAFECSVSWRGDGKYFVTLNVVRDSPSMHKRLKVWERDSGVLHATSELRPFMGVALDWMPSGAKIAAVYDRRTEEKCPSIVFFERNGLERSSFSTNELTNASIEMLRWNCQSDLLASVIRCEKHDSVKIWYFSNNHWYLKQEIRYPKQEGIKCIWDPTKPLQLICWTLSGQVTVYNFIWLTAVVEKSLALVIDDSKILVSPLFLSLMPPPLYLFSLKFKSPVRDIAFCSRNSKDHLAACLSDGSLCIVELLSPDSWEDLEGQEFSVEAAAAEVTFGSFVHLTWLDSHVLLGVSHFGFSHSTNSVQKPSCKGGLLGYYLQEIEFICPENHVPGLPTGSGWHASISSQTFAEGLIIGIALNPAKRFSAFLQFAGGKIVEYTSKLGVQGGNSKNYLPQDDDLSFPTSCPWMNVIPIGDNGPVKPVLFGLDDINRLHVSGKTICVNCSSFSFYSNSTDRVITHLIFLTKQDLLFVVDISKIMHGEVEVEYEKFLYDGKRRKEEENRNFVCVWERGAKVIGVLHGDEAAIILQTSRGNLECVYPRKLVLASIVNALVQGRFRDALVMVRRHRIDFNVIVDHCGWQAFLPLAKEFVRQVNNLNYITEFICSIKRENIMETLYKNFVQLPCPSEAKVVQARNVEDSNKVSSVLLAIRKALEEHIPESPARELCILTTLARSDPPALEEALERIKNTREMELLGSDNPKKISFPSAEEALKHLLWLLDPEAVWEAALGLYDLHLAAIVALNSQRDPKEFLPYLQQLESMAPFLMRYSIDLKLQRYESALKNIMSAGDAYFGDCMNLMKVNPQLFPLGLQLVTDSSKRREVLEAWGDHLVGEKCFEDAATTYMCCSHYEKALKAFRGCGNWSGMLTVAGFLKFGKEEVLQLAYELCEELQALGKPAEAAKIALEYCTDVKNGISLLVTAREWEEALRVAFLHGQDDLISEVKSESLECARMLIGEYEEGREKVGKYLARYLAVRQRRLLLAAKLKAEERSVNDYDDDTASEASSNFSSMSAYTTGSKKGSSASISTTTGSKVRDRRRQKNRGKIRAGSPDEEMALVEHLKGMSITSEAKRELKSLLVSLLMLGKEETAKKLQHTAESFQFSQMAAVKLAEDTISSDIIDESAQTLDRYTQKLKTEQQDSEALSWHLKVLINH